MSFLKTIFSHHQYLLIQSTNFLLHYWTAKIIRLLSKGALINSRMPLLFCCPPPKKKRIIFKYSYVHKFLATPWENFVSFWFNNIMIWSAYQIPQISYSLVINTGKDSPLLEGLWIISEIRLNLFAFRRKYVYISSLFHSPILCRWRHILSMQLAW